jgi:hypothetical protein
MSEFENVAGAESGSAARHWAVVILVVLLTIGWGLLIYALVSDRPREWDFSSLPDAPSQSIYSTRESPEGPNPPRQIPPLPEAQPKKAQGGAK